MELYKMYKRKSRITLLDLFIVNNDSVGTEGNSSKLSKLAVQGILLILFSKRATVSGSVGIVIENEGLMQSKKITALKTG